MEPARVEQILHSVLPLRQSPQSSSREGLLWFFSFLPATLNEEFAAYISTGLPVVLSGLSDDNDGVREVAMRAGQVIVSKLGLNYTNELLPSLRLVLLMYFFMILFTKYIFRVGMFNDDWRIRFSSLKLLGELLYLVGDTKATGGVEEEDDEDMNALPGSGAVSRVSNTIKNHIGEVNTTTVLASLYIVRSDISITVRQLALQIWKSIVTNTPKTLMEIMSELLQQLIDKLSDESEDMRIISGRSLGDVVTKLGDRVLPAVVPHLRVGLKSESESKRQGVCCGLTEILAACSKKQAEDYIDTLVPALQAALCDPSGVVIQQAAKAFLTLFKIVGTKAIDQVVPSLLESFALGGEEANLALKGLRELVQLRPRDLLEYLLPTLLTSPIQFVSAKALGSIADVAGNQLNYHFHTLVPSLVAELFSISDKIDKLSLLITSLNEEESKMNTEFELDFEKERFKEVKNAATLLLGAVTTSGAQGLISELGKQVEHETSIKRRRWGCWLIEQFITKSKADCTEYIPIILRYILSRVADLDKALLFNVNDCMFAVSTHIPLDDLLPHIEFIRSCVSSTASTARHTTGASSTLFATGEFLLPLFTIPKSLDPFLNILLHGLMTGSAHVRELSAESIGEFIKMADAAVIKPVLIKTTGPLIRVIGDRFPSTVKSAILDALSVLLDKGGTSLKAFVPQLQTTFVKCLNDPARDVRAKGAIALGKLIGLSLRIDPLISELTAICCQADSNAIKVSVFEAINSVLLEGGDKASSASLDKVKAIVLSNINDEDETIRQCVAACISSLSAFLDSAQVCDVIIDLLDSPKSGIESWTRIAGRIQGIAAVLQTSGQRSTEVRDEAFAFLKSGLTDDRVSIKSIACL